MDVERRTAGVLIGLLAVLCVGLLVSAAYPFTTSDPHRANPPGDRFTVSEADAYSASGSIVVNGRVRLAFDGVVTADGAWYQRVVDGDTVSEAYRSATDGTIYHRRTIEAGDDATRQRELGTESTDRVLVREERNGDHVTFVVEENGTGVAQPVSGTASVFVDSLSMVRYEANGSVSSGETVYEPRSGWYDGRETYRVTDASGDVRVDADTNVVKSADVTWDVTAPAGTYAKYVLVRSLSDEPTTYEITVEFDSDDPSLERPRWAHKAASTESVRTGGPSDPAENGTARTPRPRCRRCAEPIAGGGSTPDYGSFRRSSSVSSRSRFEIASESPSIVASAGACSQRSSSVRP